MNTFLENKLKAELELNALKPKAKALLSEPSNIPDSAGVYVIWSKESGKAAYVGETSSLKRRYRNLGKTANHTFRRTMRDEYNMQGDSDDELSKRLSKEFTYSFIEIDFGRKEVEEYLCKIWKETLKNK